MDDEDIIPADQLAIDAAAIVSETDAAHSHSSGDEAEEGWLSNRHQISRRCVGNTTTSGDEDDSDNDADMKDAAAGPGDLYSENMDDEDEAWVYKHMRGGTEELVHLQQQKQRSNSTSNNTEQADNNESNENPSKKARGSMNHNEQVDGPKSASGSTEKGKGDDSMSENLEKDTEQKSSDQNKPSTPQNPQLQQALLLKPRTSDAILSCPRCFNIVCMDCQQHERYANQYRAMFVMNIGVDWNKRMVYDEAVGGIKSDASAGVEGGRGAENDAVMQLDDATAPDTIPHDTSLEHDTASNKEKEELYYSVHCSYCQWEVAALDMKDEIYYFFGCIASS